MYYVNITYWLQSQQLQKIYKYSIGVGYPLFHKQLIYFTSKWKVALFHTMHSKEAIIKDDDTIW